MDQGRQAGRKDDAAELPPVPVERGAAVAERDRIQPGQSVAEAGTAAENRQRVAYPLATAVGETCPLLLAAVGREPSDAAHVRKHAAAHGGSAAASGVGLASRRNQSGRRWRLRERCPKNRYGMRQIMALLVPATAQLGRPGVLGWNRCKKIACGGNCWYIGSQSKSKTEISV